MAKLSDHETQFFHAKLAEFQEARPEWSESLAEALGDIGSVGPVAAARIALERASDDLLPALCILLGELRAAASPAASSLDRLLSHSEPRIRAAAALALGRIGPGAECALERLSMLQDDSILYVRIAAAAARAHILKRDATCVVDHLRQLLCDVLAMTTANAAAQDLKAIDVQWLLSGIGACADRATAAVPEVIRVFDLSSVALRVQACHALAAIRDISQDAIDALRRALQSEHQDVRSYAAFALAYTIGKEATDVEAVLVEAMNDERPEVRFAMRSALCLLSDDNSRRHELFPNHANEPVTQTAGANIYAHTIEREPRLMRTMLRIQSLSSESEARASAVSLAQSRNVNSSGLRHCAAYLLSRVTHAVDIPFHEVASWYANEPHESVQSTLLSTLHQLDSYCDDDTMSAKAQFIGLVVDSTVLGETIFASLAETTLFQRLMASAAHRHVRSAGLQRQLADDVVNSAYIRILKRFTKNRTLGFDVTQHRAFLTWLQRVVNSNVYDAIGDVATGRGMSWSTGDESRIPSLAEIVDYRENRPEMMVMHRELIQLLWETLLHSPNISGDESRAFLLRFLYGSKWADIGAALKVSEDHARYLARRAREHLVEVLEARESFIQT